MLDRILDHLRILVSSDTTNPPRAIDADTLAIAHARDSLERCGFDVVVEDLGEGSVNVFARRGEPRVLFNCHLDTVPAAEGWTRDPFELKVSDGRATGLGACDIKGAGACILAAAEATDAPVAILFSSDEEAGAGDCVRTFLERTPWKPDLAIVAEPTGCEAVLAHRGLASCEAWFKGEAGHTSVQGASSKSAIHRALRWGSAALELASDESRWGPDDALRFNVGVVEGGFKSNMVAENARLRFGMRPAPGLDLGETLEAFKSLIDPASGEWQEFFAGPPLAHNPEAQRQIGALGIPIAEPVPFWTEAALFGAAGVPACVLGPGSIAQAHAPDEFVELNQLEQAAAIYASVMNAQGAD